MIQTNHRYFSLITDNLNVSKDKGPFGHPYGFYLADGLVGRRIITQNKEEIIEYVPEYLVLVKELTKLAREYGLELQESLNFHDFYSENIQDRNYFNVFKNKIRFDFSGESPLLMDPELWDVSYLYR